MESEDIRTVQIKKKQYGQGVIGVFSCGSVCVSAEAMCGYSVGSTVARVKKTDILVKLWPCGGICSIAGGCVSLPMAVSNPARMQTVTKVANVVSSCVFLPPCAILS